MAISLQVYESQVINFLKSCTIVFSPMATQMNNVLTNSRYTITEDQTTWKYYLNLSGQYHPTDTVMYVQSLDTKLSVAFTIEMLASSPKTAAAYVIGSSYYNNLCAQYPTQIDLIKSILYPVDINDAITASDFTLLGWGNGYLESTEQEAIIYEINNFISYVVSRWYFPFFNYEVYYTWTYWASLWQVLSNVIFAARLKYLHTSYVHSFHIWASLESLGIGDYSDVLSRQQALFLYRNINYLLDNRGTQSNLIILVNNLLADFNVGLVGKTIYMNTYTDAANLNWVPEFVSDIIPTNNSQSLTIIPPETLTQINSELYTAGYDISNSVSYVATQQSALEKTTLNIIPTKIVEIQKLAIDKKYGGVLVNFILDTLVYCITSGIYTAEVDIVDPTTSIAISLPAKDALALYYYAVQRSLGTPAYNQPVTDGINNLANLPTLYTPTSAFKPNLTTAIFPEIFNYDGTSYVVNSYISTADMIEGVIYPSTPVDNGNDFSTMLANFFLVLVKDIRYSRTEGNLISQKIFVDYMYDYVLQRTSYSFSLSTYTDYSSWANNLNLTDLFSNLDNRSDYTTVYATLADTISTALVPQDAAGVFNYFSYTSAEEENIYDRLRTLFEQLCSYNIAFLDTSRINNWWFLSDRILSYPSSITDNTPLAFLPTSGYSGITSTETNYLSIDTADTTLGIQPTSNNSIYLTDDDMISVGVETVDQVIQNPFTLKSKEMSVTDTTYINCTLMLTPRFCSVT